MEKKLKEAARAFSDGDFEKAHNLYEECFIEWKFLVVQGTVTQKQANQVLQKI